MTLKQIKICTCREGRNPYMNCKNGPSLMEKLSPSEQKLHASNALMKPHENVSIIFFLIE